MNETRSNEKRSRRRLAVVVLVSVVAIGAFASGASAERERCGVGGFVLPIDSQSWTATYTGDANVAHIMGEWTSGGSTILTCGSRAIHIDVWEHVYGVKVDPKAGDDTVILTGSVSYRLTGDFDGDGRDSIVSLEGRISGDGVQRDDVATLTFSGRGSSSDGSKIKLRHRGTLDLRGEEWRDLEVRSGVYRPGASTFVG
jgi:hypothetical protein